MNPWDDYKFKPLPIPMKTPEPTAPAPTTNNSGGGIGYPFDQLQKSPFGGLLGMFGQAIFNDSNPKAQSMLNMPFIGPMLGGLFGMGGGGSSAPAEQPVANTDPVALTQAERIKELTSYLTNKKLGT